jgi:hypothetical protein
VGRMQGIRNIKVNGVSCALKVNVFVGGYTMLTSDRI